MNLTLDPDEAAARTLGEMAGWTTPPDVGDPAVLRLARQAAQDRLDAAATLTLGPPDLPARVEHLLAVIDEHAPTAAYRVSVRATARALLADGHPVNGVELMLAGMLLDGLRHGNWPWS